MTKKEAIIKVKIGFSIFLLRINRLSSVLWIHAFLLIIFLQHKTVKAIL